MSRAAIFLALAIACSSKTEPPRSEPPPDVTPPASATPAPEAAPDVPEPPDQPPDRTPARPAQRGRPIEVMLRSSPPGALAAVDGKPIGHTPTYWAGEADGREHEFTFALRGYVPARYRFVPITTGVVHARLEVLADEPEPSSAVFRVPDAARAPTPDAAPGPTEPAPATGAGPQP